MKIDAVLAGMTPKSTPTGRVIEVKLVAEFSLSTLEGLGQMFGQTVTAKIGLQQPDLEFDSQNREGD